MALSVDLSILDQPPVVTGSVQRMFTCEIDQAPYLLSEALDVGSVFDVGTFFSVNGSGAYRNSLRHNIYCDLQEPNTWEDVALAVERYFSDSEKRARLIGSQILASLKSRGARTHHVGLVDAETGALIEKRSPALSPLVLIEPFPVLKPQHVLLAGQYVYDYSAHARASRKVLGLENVVRLGIPRGSHVADHYVQLRNAGQADESMKFLQEIGLSDWLDVWSALPDPTCDWAAKYEDYDRHLTAQEALHISGKPAGELQDVVDLLMLCTAVVGTRFQRGGLNLWDLKWEVAYDSGGPVIVDTMDHDSMRITSSVDIDGRPCNVHFNKQAVRDYYRILHPEWHRSLGVAKKLSNETGQPFMEIYLSKVATGEFPAIPPLQDEYSALLAEKYRYVNEAWLKEPNASDATDLVERELDFYKSRGELEKFVRYSSPERL